MLSICKGLISLFDYKAATLSQEGLELCSAGRKDHMTLQVIGACHKNNISVSPDTHGRQELNTGANWNTTG